MSQEMSKSKVLATLFAEALEQINRRQGSRGAWRITFQTERCLGMHDGEYKFYEPGFFWQSAGDPPAYVPITMKEMEDLIHGK